MISPRAEQNEDGLPSWVEPRPRSGLERFKRWWRERRFVRRPEPEHYERRSHEGAHPPPPAGPGAEPKGMQ